MVRYYFFLMDFKAIFKAGYHAAFEVSRIKLKTAIFGFFLSGCIVGCSGSSDSSQPQSIVTPAPSGIPTVTPVPTVTPISSPLPVSSPVACEGDCNFPGSIILGKPTNEAITLSVVADADAEIMVQYGLSPNSYSNTTNSLTAQSNEPLNITLDNLTANSTYYYRMNLRHVNSNDFIAYQPASFSTQRSESSSFVFAIHADAHVGIRVRGPEEEEKADDGMYSKTLKNTLLAEPDFMIDLGDTFMSEKNQSRDFYAPDDGIDKTPATQAWVKEDYQYLRSFFSQLGHSVPVFLVNGNHEGESGWEKNNEESVAVWANNLRQELYPAVDTNNFYSGSFAEETYTGKHNGYYAWRWGAAEFIALDPFWYASVKPKLNSEWEWTLGKDQYDWLKTTLEQSTATFKFIFLHNLVGGKNDDVGLGRGGALVASDWEWGGLNPNTGENEFAQNRPGWDKPIHDLLVQYGVNVVFHGHDHVYVKEEHSDGIIYQDVPQPSVLGDTSARAIKRAQEAGYDTVNGVVQHGSGFLKITVTPENFTVDFVRSLENAIVSDDCTGILCSEIATSYTVNREVINP